VLALSNKRQTPS